MKTLLATLMLAVAAAPAAAGPDFVTSNRTPRPLAASSGVREIAPIDDILFALDSDALSAEALQKLTSAAAWLKRHPSYRLVLEGYTDRSGPRDYNEDLATSRAAAARDLLIQLGVPADRLLIVVYGETAARAQYDALSRRVVFYATDRGPREIALASLEKKHALSAAWVRQGTLFSERRLPERGVLVGSR
jgi:outer membrane protein OmpA-like peptidoglycan-associated protein